MKYYLVNYTAIPDFGTIIPSSNCEMYEFEDVDSPKECYDFMKDDLNRDTRKPKAHRIITDMKLIK